MVRWRKAVSGSRWRWAVLAGALLAGSALAAPVRAQSDDGPDTTHHSGPPKPRTSSATGFEYKPEFLSHTIAIPASAPPPQPPPPPRPQPQPQPQTQAQQGGQPQTSSGGGGAPPPASGGRPAPVQASTGGAASITGASNVLGIGVDINTTSIGVANSSCTSVGSIAGKGC